MINVNWSELPIDLLIRIVENHIPSVDDVIVFSSVCHSWNRAARSRDRSQLPENGFRQMPWLMLTDGNDDEVYSDTGSFTKHFYQSKVKGLSDSDADADADSDSYYTSSDDEDQLQAVQSAEDDLLTVDSYYYSNVNGGKRKLLNLSHNRNKCYNLSIPEAYGKACWGSRYGWIVTLGLNRQMHLFNPLTKAQLPLPSQTTFRYPLRQARDETIRLLFFTKVVVLHVPLDGKNVPWLVVAIHGGYLLVAIARPGDASWMHISWPDGIHDFRDVLYCTKMKMLVFLDVMGDLFYYDVHNSEQPQEFYSQGPDNDCRLTDYANNMGQSLYLVQCADDLLVVARYKRFIFTNRDFIFKTENFRVFRHSFPTRSWEEMSNLGNVALFVGGNETVCIAASEAGCRRNCIYFCDDLRCPCRFNQGKVEWHDLGVFNFGNKTIETIDDRNNWKSSYCIPFWFTPAL